MMSSLCHLLTRGFVVLIILSLTFGIVSCKSNKYPGYFTSDTIMVDGNFNDWQDIPTTYYEKKDVLLGICNDETNLYVAVRFKEPMWARSIKMSGFSIWLNNEGKEDKTFGIRYHGGPSMEEMQKLAGTQKMAREDMPEGRPEGMPEGMKERMSEREPDSTRQFAVMNEEWWYKEQYIPTDGSSGPAAGFSYDKGMYTYEFSIPLQSAGENFFAFNSALGGEYAICLKWGEIEMGESGDRPEGGMGGGPPGGGMDGGPPGGGMGGGRPGGGPGGMRGQSDMPEEQEIWLKSVLPASNSSEENSDSD